MTGMSAASIPLTISRIDEREAAGRVHLDHDRLVALLLAALDRVEQEVLRHRVDVVLELGDEDARVGGSSAARSRGNGECGRGYRCGDDQESPARAATP